jgi:hypothetical protein
MRRDIMSETMKINVKVEVPKGNRCSFINCNFYGLNNNCRLFHCKLGRIDICEAYKCSACIVACQKATEQQIEEI